MKKRFLSLAAATVLTGALLAGCGNSSSTAATEAQEATEAAATEAATEAAAEGDGSLKRVQDAGVLLVGTEGTYSPFSYHDEANNLVGYDVEVAQKVAEKLGVEAEFVETKWDSIIAGLDARRFDVIINQVGVTAERQEKYDFTIPYTYTYGALIVTGDNDEITGFEDLEGKKAAHSLTSSWAAISESYGAELVGVDGFDQAIELLIAGRADFTINDTIAFYDYLNQKPDADIKIVAQEEDVIISAIPVRKEDKELHDAIDQALVELGEEGVLTELSEKYFGADVSHE